jgi:CMP-N,N'-diacetyllegionaminic acid synthase
MTKRILSIIPARGGSKGLPRKNIIDLAGRPLIAWTIEASLKSKYITRTIVSSDDKEILSISRECGAEVIIRPNDLASDTATSESVLKHAIDYLEAAGEFFDVVILLQPTSPLRDHRDIDNAFESMFDSNAKSVVSVYELDNKCLKVFTENSSGHLRSAFNDKYPFMRRQDLPLTYMPNGAIYIVKIISFQADNSFMTDRTLGFVMPKEVSVDIDSLSDLNTLAFNLP